MSMAKRMSKRDMIKQEERSVRDWALEALEQYATGNDDIVEVEGVREDGRPKYVRVRWSDGCQALIWVGMEIEELPDGP